MSQEDLKATVKRARELLQSVPEGDWSIESHGDGEALYIDRRYGSIFEARHGLNIVHLKYPAYQWPQVKQFIVAAPKLLADLVQVFDQVEAARDAAEHQIGQILSAFDESLDAMIARPRMYGAPQALEARFLLLLELKRVALGRSADEPIQNTWMLFVHERFPRQQGRSLSECQDTWRHEDFVEHLRAFRSLVGL